LFRRDDAPKLLAALKEMKDGLDLVRTKVESLTRKVHPPVFPSHNNRRNWRRRTNRMHDTIPLGHGVKLAVVLILLYAVVCPPLGRMVNAHAGPRITGSDGRRLWRQAKNRRPGKCRTRGPGRSSLQIFGTKISGVVSQFPTHLASVFPLPPSPKPISHRAPFPTNLL
jgi:hypothetical protein